MTLEVGLTTQIELGGGLQKAFEERVKLTELGTFAYRRGCTFIEKRSFLRHIELGARVRHYELLTLCSSRGQSCERILRLLS